MSTILGIDYGTSKVGLALGDSQSKVATPLHVVGPKELPLEIERLVEREGISQVVFGLPLGMNGQETETTKLVKKFAKKLGEQISLPIAFEDERLSTVQAQKQGKDDAVAAMYILQSYLDRHYG